MGAARRWRSDRPGEVEDGAAVNIPHLKNPSRIEKDIFRTKIDLIKLVTKAVNLIWGFGSTAQGVHTLPA